MEAMVHGAVAPPRIDIDAIGSDAVTGDTADVLGRVAEGASFALWRRALDPVLAAWVDATSFESLPRVSIEGTPETVAEAVLVAWAEAEAPRGPYDRQLIQALAADAAALAARLPAAGRMAVRLEPMRHDGCWKFHRDRVPLRLVTSYRGPGTEIVPAEHAQRALDDQRTYRGPRLRLDRGWVALFRGDPDGREVGTVHRSPPIAAKGLTRLVLCITAYDFHA